MALLVAQDYIALKIREGGCPSFDRTVATWPGLDEGTFTPLCALMKAYAAEIDNDGKPRKRTKVAKTTRTY